MSGERVYRAVLAFSAFFLLSGSPDPPPARALPIETDTALTVGFESNAVRAFTRVIRKSGPKGAEAVIYSMPWVVPVRIRPDMVAIGILPWRSMTLKTRLSGRRMERSSAGLGDVQFFVKHAFYRKDGLKKTVRLAWIAGIKLPTGDETTTPPLGSGSVDFTIGGILTRIADRFAIHADLKYRVNTQANGLRAGNALKHDLALEYRVMPRRFRSLSDKTVNLILELNGRYAQADRRGGAAVADTGGEILFLSPGIQLVANPRLMVEALLQHPIIQALRGTQPGVDYTASLGFRYAF